ncbi:amidase family protein [Yoonia sp.]|uniref:amidase family protein n=1 Tax=Yoonia sp. TaxID=2212373 RepID=UPI0039759A85
MLSKERHQTATGPSVVRSQWFRAFVTLTEKYDALALPSAQVWPFPNNWTFPKTINGMKMDTYHRRMEVVVPVSLIGVPSLAIPAGFSDKRLPMGFQLFGRRGDDRKLLSLGQAYHLHNYPPFKGLRRSL